MATPATRSRSALIGVGILVVALGFGLPRLVADPTPTPNPEPATSDTPDLGWALARLVGGLVVVCALCIGVTRFLGRRAVGPPSADLDLLASARVNARCAVYLVRAGARRLLVGLDSGGIKALVELPGPPPDDATGPALEAELARLLAQAGRA